MDRNQYIDQIFQKQEELSTTIHSYWSQYSHMGTWQFWMVTSLLITPLIVLVFAVDRKRIFEVLFFGFVVHVLWTYSALALSNLGYFAYNYYSTPILPTSLNMTASVLPVSFLLLYQYCTNHQKNFFLYLLVLSAFFAFGFASIEIRMEFLELRDGLRQLHLFMSDIVIGVLAYFLTQLLSRYRIE
ncbi:CBO0543 family protein [Evansella sp. AB-rgal1]|uniref:CBO0543 family protein n=1 Tax=Evansella sp. AB-rgal1 TaxID=3242696 RepID=UPI00359ED9E5